MPRQSATAKDDCFSNTSGANGLQNITIPLGAVSCTCRRAISKADAPLKIFVSYEFSNSHKIKQPELSINSAKSDIQVQIIKSAARTKTLQAKYNEKQSVLTVAVPATLKEAEIRAFVDKCLKKLTNRHKIERNQTSLNNRALLLARKYFGLSLKFSSIVYTDSYTRAWGKCYPASREIKINTRLIDFPEWVEDYVIIHELAHLIEPNHSPDFWKLAERYELKERAVGYLMAKGIEEDEI